MRLRGLTVTAKGTRLRGRAQFSANFAKLSSGFYFLQDIVIKSAMETIDIYCTNTSEHYEFDRFTTLKEMSDRILGGVLPDGGRILAAYCDNQLKGLSYKPLQEMTVEFLSYSNPNGHRTYTRSLCFVLQNAVKDLFPDKWLRIDYSLPGGLYCEIREKEVLEDGRPAVCRISADDIARIREKMRETVAADLPFVKVKMSTEDACKLFRQNGFPEKVKLMESLGRFHCSVYYLDGRADSYHGPLLPSTSYLDVFDLEAFNQGFCLKFPMPGAGRSLLPLARQSIIADALKEHSDKCAIIGVSNLGTLNRAIQEGWAVKLINLCETNHERSYSTIAQAISDRRDSVKIVFIAGPSSSGKTSSSLRLALHCKVLGLNPKVIELDNYFVNREHTPKDENGDYDFESLHAMDLALLNRDLNALVKGEEIDIPRYNFKTGERHYDGKRMRLEENDILIMEGIHALNPEMVPGVDASRIFRVYVSALTSLSIDENNNISTSDNRLLRRMVRDNRVRGISPEETITRWRSVRRGESRNIFPFQENADAVFNSALLFELPMLKYYAEPLLWRISPVSPAFPEASRLLKFLDSIVALSPEEIAAIPPTSILREFIGGQTL